MLDAHPDLAIPAETGFFITLASAGGNGSYPATAEQLTALLTRSHPWKDLTVPEGEFSASLLELPRFSVGEGLRVFYRMYAGQHGKVRWGDKSPHHCYHIPAIHQVLPEAHVIHIIRDGRDVALSLRDVWFSPGRDPAILATSWRNAVEAARRDGARHPRYIEIRYEDLILNPRAVLEQICSYLELPFSPAMLQYHESAINRLNEVHDSVQPDGTVVPKSVRLAQHRLTSSPPEPGRIGRWGQAFTAVELNEFYAIAGPLLKELGYLA